MSLRRWTCLGCGWEGHSIAGEAGSCAYTAEGAKRCPTCKSGALVLADPEAQLKSAAGAAKRINLEREKKLQREVPLLLHAGIERPKLTNAEEVLARREVFERFSAISTRKEEEKRLVDLEKARAVRAELAKVLHPDALASLDAKLAPLPRDYTLGFWSDVAQRHDDGSLAAEAAEEVAAATTARHLRELTLSLVSPEERAELDRWADEHRYAGTVARLYWHARLREARGIPMMRANFKNPRAGRWDDEFARFHLHIIVVVPVGASCPLRQSARAA